MLFIKYNKLVRDKIPKQESKRMGKKRFGRTGKKILIKKRFIYSHNDRQREND